MNKVGETFSKPYLFTVENIRRYAEQAGDQNPLHHDPEAAGNSRFGTIIACGAHMSGILMSLAASHLAGMKESVGLEFQFRFVKAMPAGTQVLLSWTVTDVAHNEKLKGDLVTMDGKIADEAGTVYVTAQSKGVVWP